MLTERVTLAIIGFARFAKHLRLSGSRFSCNVYSILVTSAKRLVDQKFKKDKELKMPWPSIECNNKEGSYGYLKHNRSTLDYILKTIHHT